MVHLLWWKYAPHDKEHSFHENGSGEKIKLEGKPSSSILLWLPHMGGLSCFSCTEFKGTARVSCPGKSTKSVQILKNHFSLQICLILADKYMITQLNFLHSNINLLRKCTHLRNTAGQSICLGRGLDILFVFDQPNLISGAFLKPTLSSHCVVRFLRNDHYSLSADFVQFNWNFCQEIEG